MKTRVSSRAKMRVRLRQVIACGTLLGLVLALIPMGQDAEPLAKRKKKKKALTGKYDEGVYTDKELGFTVEISDQWSVKLKKLGNNVRFAAEKKDYSVPIPFRENEFLTTAPMLKVFVDTSSMNPREFLDSLYSKSYKSDQKKSIKASLKIFDGRTKRPVVSRLKLKNGYKGIRAKILRSYSLEVPRGVGQVGDVVQDKVQGDLAILKTMDDKHIIILSGICESLYYRKVNEPFMSAFFESLKLTISDDGK